MCVRVCARAFVWRGCVRAHADVWRGRALRPGAGLRAESGSRTYQAARGRAPQCRSSRQPTRTAWERWVPERKTLALPDPSLAARAPRRPLGLPSPHKGSARAGRRPDAGFGPLSLGSSFVPSKRISPEERALRGTAQPSVAW